jgi:hypothetical protein
MRSQSAKERRRSGRTRKLVTASIAFRWIRRVGARPHPHRIVLAGDLVLAGFDHRAQKRQRVGEPVQLVERD